MLVSSDERPIITDFGVSRLLVDGVTVAGTSSLKGNVRWMAIELIDPQAPLGTQIHQLHTKATDMWAFGMVLYVSHASGCDD